MEQRPESTCSFKTDEQSEEKTNEEKSKFSKAPDLLPM